MSRTSAPGVYAAGDCTGVLMLASVAAMQGRIAMWHALGEAVQPIRLSHVASTIFTDPEIASVGVSQAAVDRGEVPARVVKLPLATNPRAKMGGIRDGFVKIFARPGTGLVLGGVVVAPRASELILPLSIAVEQNLSVDQIAHTFSVYPSLSGSVTEAARTVMEFGTDAISCSAARGPRPIRRRGRSRPGRGPDEPASARSGVRSRASIASSCAAHASQCGGERLRRRGQEPSSSERMRHSPSTTSRLS